MMDTPQTRYDRKNCVNFGLKLNRKTDAEIIEKLQSQKNRQGYIKELIRRDIAGEEPEE